MLKKYFSFGIFLLLTHTMLFSQNEQFPNLDFSNLPAPPNLPSSFYQIGTAATSGSQPWQRSHGTPDIIVPPIGSGGSPTLRIGAGKKGTPNPTNSCWDAQCDNDSEYSEGALYPYPFKSGMKITLSGILSAGQTNSANVDEVRIDFVKGISPFPICSSVPPPGNESFDYPNFSSRQEIEKWEDINVQNEEFTKTIVLNDDYTHIWFSIKDNDADCAINHSATATFRDLEIDECCQDEVIIDKTHTFILGSPYTTGIQPKTYASELIGLYPDPDYTNGSYTDFEVAYGSGDGIELISGERIHFKPTEIPNHPGEGSIHIKFRSKLNARIADCDCEATNICNKYVDDGYEHNDIGNGLNLNSNCSTVWTPVFFYPEPYNAHTVTWGIFEGDNSNGQVAGGSIEDFCNPIPLNFISWDGTTNGQNVNSGVFTYFIQLNNCHEEKIITGDITVGTFACATSDDEIAFNNSSNESDLGLENMSLKFNAYPNPFVGKVDVSFVLEEDQNGKITVYDSSISKVYTKNNRFLKGENFVDINLSHLPNGTYFITLEAGDSFYSKKLIKAINKP